MKTNQFFKSFLVIVLALLVVGCVKGDEYDVPSTGGEEPDVIVNSSVSAVKEAWNQNNATNGEGNYTFEVTTNGLYFEGYVVSSDLAGNFYKKLIIQDKAEGVSHGIEVLVNKTSLFESFEVGRKVYVKLDGLSVTYDDGDENNPNDGTPGRYTLGYLIDGTVDEIPSFIYTDHILRSLEREAIVPNVVEVEDFDQDHINTMVQILGMQFSISELGKTYAGESNDEFDGMRVLLSCANQATTTLQTSTYSDFKSYTVAEGQGAINAVLAKDFRADFYVLIINDPTDLDFSSTDRCDPVLLDCGNNSVGGATVLFDENFDETSEAQLEADGWVNTNMNGGGEQFDLRSFSGDGYMQVSAFRSGENPMEVWLISPAIDLSGTTDEELTFDTKVGYYNGDALSVYVSTDFTGDIDAATWSLVQADLANGPTNGYGSTLTPSGSINLSCLEGNVFVAFKYLGADSGITTTFQLENVKVTGN